MSTLWLDLRDAATIAGHSLRHFNRIIQDKGQPKVHHLGTRGKRFILRSELDAWLKQKKRKTA